MTTQTSKFNAGTGSFQKKNSAGNSAFSMSSASWLTLQTFFNTIEQLPITTSALATALGPGAPSDMSDYDKLVTLYAQMSSESTKFTATIYPFIVNVASDVYNYAEAVPEYYTGLQQLIKQLSADPAPTGEALKTIQTNLTAVLDQLANNIKPFITKASKAKSDLANLVNTMQGYTGTLGSNSPQPNGSGYWAYYHTEYGSDSKNVKELNSEIATQSANLQKYQKEYNHDVIVAATSVTYGWIFPVGTIAAGITAGIYGAKATAAKHAIAAANSLITTFSQKEQADIQTMNYLNLASNNIQTVHDEMSTALGILEGIEGNWNAISSDLTNLSNNLKKNFEGTIGFLLQIDFNTAITDWSNLQKETNAYRTNAFITVSK